MAINFAVLNKSIQSEYKVFEKIETKISFYLLNSLFWVLIAIEDEFCEEKVDKSYLVLDIDSEYYRLLYSALHYPPAIAIASESEVWLLPEFKNSDSRSFLESYCKIIQREMDNQRENKYFISRVTKSRSDLIEGYYHWIVRKNEEKSTVNWVSDDYQIYESDGDLFDLN